MKLFLISVTTILFSSFCATAQVSDQTVDFILVKNTILAIKQKGHVAVCDVNGTRSDSIIALPSEDAGKILSIAKSSTGEVFLGTEKGGIYKADPMGTTFHSKIKYPVQFLAVNSRGRLITVVPYGVYDPITGKYWDKFTNHTSGRLVKNQRGKRLTEYFEMPQYVFLDSNDILWMIASFGEFGGALEIFDTRKMEIVNTKFDSLSMGLLFPRSIFQGQNSQLLLTSGLQHFMNRGTIYSLKADGKSSTIFESDGNRRLNRKTGVVSDEGGMFIGPGAYNKLDNCLYFSTERGIFKARLNSDGVISKPELVVKPELSWTSEAKAIGAAMAYKKLAFTDEGELVFLTTNNGIGVLRKDGRVVFLEL